MNGYDEAPLVTVYHRCPVFAVGSIFVGREPAHWFAQRDAAAWRIRIVGVQELERPVLEARIRRIARLDIDAAGAAAAAQDARAEAPDV